MKNILRNSIHIGTVFILLVGFKTVMPAFWVGHCGNPYNFGTNLIEADVPNNNLSSAFLTIGNGYIDILRKAKQATPSDEHSRWNLIDPTNPISNDHAHLRVNVKFQVIDIDLKVVPEPFNAVWHYLGLRDNFVQWGRNSRIFSGLLNQNGLVQDGANPIALDTLEEMDVYPHDDCLSPDNGHFSLADNTKVAFFWATATHKVGDVRTISFIPTLLNTSPELFSLLTGPEIKSLFAKSFDPYAEGQYLTYKDLINILKIVSGGFRFINSNNELDQFNKIKEITERSFKNLLPVTHANQDMLKKFYKKMDNAWRVLGNSKKSLEMAYTFLEKAFVTDDQLATPILMKTGNNYPLAAGDMGIGIVPVAGVVKTTRPTPSPSTTTLPPLTPAPAPITPSTRVWSTDCASANYETPPTDAECFICFSNENEDENRLINIAYNENQIDQNYIHEECLRTMIESNTKTNANGAPLCPELINKYSATDSALSDAERSELDNVDSVIANNIFILNRLMDLPKNPYALAFFYHYLKQDYFPWEEETLNGDLDLYVENQVFISAYSLLTYEYFRKQTLLDLLRTRLNNDVATLRTLLTKDPSNTSIYKNQLREKEDFLEKLTAFENWLENEPITPRTTISTAFDREALDELIQKINQFDATEASYPEVLKAACEKLPLGWRVLNSPFKKQFLTVPELSDPDKRKKLTNELTALRESLTPLDSSSITAEQEELRKQESFKFYLKQTIDKIGTRSNIPPTALSEFLSTLLDTYQDKGMTYTPSELYNELNQENKEIIIQYYNINPRVTAARVAQQEEIRAYP